MKRIFLVICALYVLNPAEASGEVMDVQAFLEAKIDAVKSVMRRPNLPDPVKKEHVIQIITSRSIRY